MAKDANVSITPAVVAGMWDLWPPGTLFPSPGTIKFVIFPFFLVSFCNFYLFSLS